MFAWVIASGWLDTRMSGPGDMVFVVGWSLRFRNRRP